MTIYRYIAQPYLDPHVSPLRDFALLTPFTRLPSPVQDHRVTRHCVLPSQDCHPDMDRQCSCAFRAPDTLHKADHPSPGPSVSLTPTPLPSQGCHPTLDHYHSTLDHYHSYSFRAFTELPSNSGPLAPLLPPPLFFFFSVTSQRCHPTPCSRHSR